MGSIKIGASHFGLMIKGQGLNLLKASSSVISIIDSSGKFSWITWSVALSNSFFSWQVMLPIEQFHIKRNFKAKNVMFEEKS